MEVLKSALWILLGRWAYNIIGLISFAVIVSRLDVSDYGIWAIVSTALIFSDIFFQDAAENALVRQEGDERQVIWSGFWVILLFSIFLSGSLIVISLVVSALYIESLYSELLWGISALVVVQAISSVARGVLLRRRMSKAFSLSLSFANLVGAVFGIVAVFLNLGIWSLLVQQSTLHLVVLIVTWNLSRLGRPQPGTPQLRGEIARFVWYGMWSSVLNVGVNRIDIVLASTLFGPTAAGLFALAKRIIQISQDLVGSSFDKALIALRSQMLREETQQREPAVKKATFFGDNPFIQAVTLQAMLIIPAFAGLSITASIIVPLIFGPQWIQASQLVALMSIGGVFRAMVTLERAEQVVSGHVGRLLLVRVGELIITLSLLLPFGHLGVEVIAGLFSARYFLSYLLVVAVNPTDARFTEHLVLVARALWPALIGSVLMAISMEIVKRMTSDYSSALQLAACFIVGLVVYLVIMLLLRRHWMGTAAD